MSDWTEWTQCKQTQTRNRSVLRYPSQYSIGSEDCAPAQDVKVCIKGENCFEYSWELSDWTSCMINDGSEACGTGHKERFAMCRNEAGQRVDDVKCMEHGVCGSGLQERNVSCVGGDGLPVNSSRCPHDTEKLVLQVIIVSD
nr:hypothetical protein BaRGS_033329 [Batillaria attramentaria]